MDDDRTVRVLLIEDNLADVDLIREMLDEAGDTVFALEHASHLSTGLERAAAGDIDLILLDLALPDSRGLETFGMAHIRVPQIPIVVLSGADDARLAIEAVRRGAQDYLVKDQVNGHLLVRAIRYALERARSARERAQAEEALRKSEEKFSKAFQSSPLAVLITRLSDGKFIEVNQTVERFLGYRRDELIGRTSLDLGLVNPQDREKVKSILQEHGAFSNSEARFYTKSGEERIGLFSGEVIEIEGEACIIQVMSDITKRVRSEQERAWVEAERDHLWKQVQEQAQRMQQIVDTVPEGVLLLDTDHRVILANPLGKKELGTLAQATEGDVLTHLGDRPLLELLTSPPKGLWHEVSAANRSFQVIARPIENGPTPKGWVLVIRDVTQQREFEQRVQQQERLAAIGQLTAGIAHDFNNIMAVITLYANISLRTPDLPDKMYERMVTVDEQARRASDLIQQLMDFSRRTVLERSTFDLLAFLKEQVKLLQRTLPENIHISLAYDPDTYTIDADLTRMQQVIMNLATNARDAMPEGGQLRFVLTRIQIENGKGAPLPEMALQYLSTLIGADAQDAKGGNWICLTVADTGCGIPPDALPHIFDPFFTTKAPGSGTGLGLSQVYGIITQHQGHIDVSTLQGEGTTFNIYLPTLAVDRSEHPLQKTQQLPQGQGEVILVVEDEGITRKAVISGLEMLGYRVLEAADGQEALKVFEQHANQIDLVLSDMVMPNMGGRALFQALKQLDADEKVVLMTGHPLEEGELEPLLTQGLEGWLPKPPSLEQLAQAVAQALEKKANE